MLRELAKKEEKLLNNFSLDPSKSWQASRKPETGLWEFCQARFEPSTISTVRLIVFILLVLTCHAFLRFCHPLSKTRTSCKRLEAKQPLLLWQKANAVLGEGANEPEASATNELTFGDETRQFEIFEALTDSLLLFLVSRIYL